MEIQRTDCFKIGRRVGVGVMRRGTRGPVTLSAYGSALSRLDSELR